VVVHQRRKAVVGLLLYLVRVLGKIENLAKPTLDLSLLEGERDDVKEVLESLKSRVSVTRAEDSVDVALEMGLMMELVEEYLRMEYLGEGGAAAILQEVNTELMGITIKGSMKLPDRYIYITFADKADDKLFEELSENIAPNHLIIITSLGERKEYYSKPRFMGENKVLWGKVVLLPASLLLEKVARIRGAVDFEFSDKSVKFTLMTKF